jgi:RNA polymerase sigma factor for flagellar operon FliA
MAQNIHRRLPQNVDIDDLFSAGLVGLIEAYAKFNPAKNTKFATYAYCRIRGAILDSLRILDWAPRVLRRRARALREAIRTLTLRLGHPPSEEEVAAELKISLNAYQKLLGDLDRLEIVPLYRKRKEDSDDEGWISVPSRPENDPLFFCMRSEMKKRLTRAIEDLSEQERLAIILSYYEELTRPEISLALGVSKARVQQIRASAVCHLRMAFSDIASGPA